MSSLITKETNRSIDAFIESIKNPSIEEDSKLLISIMKESNMRENATVEQLLLVSDLQVVDSLVV